MFKKLIALVVISVLAVPVSVNSATAAVKAGSSCPKSGNMTSAAGKNFTCTRSGKKLVWILINSSKPNPVPANNNSPVQVSNNSPVENCKIKDLRVGKDIGVGAGAVGFPLAYNRMKPNGLVKVAIVPVNFPNSPKVDKPESYLRKYLDLLDQRNTYLYGDRIKYEWTFIPDWLMMPKNAEYFASDHVTVQSDGSRKSDGVNQLLSTDEQLRMIFTEAEKQITLNDYDFHWIFTNPLESKVPQGPVAGNLNQTFTTDKSKYSLNFYALGNRVYSGQWMLWGIKGSTLQDTIAHEMAHYHGMLQHAPGNGWGWYISNNPTWEAWLTGWRPDSEYVCFDVKEDWQTTTFNLSAIDLNSTGFKSGVIKISDSQALVIESRRSGPFTTALPKTLAGITVYLVDTKKSGERWDGNLAKENDYYLAFLRIKNPDHAVPKYSNLAMWDENIIAYQGDRFEYGNVRIELIKSAGFDTIKLSKI